MSVNITGTVKSLGSKDFGEGAKAKTYHNFFLEGDNTMYRTGTVNSGVAQNDQVAFFLNEKGFVDMGSLQINGATANVSAPPPTSSPAPKKKSWGGGGNKSTENWDARQQYWDNKEVEDGKRQNMISYQAAINSATNIVNAAVESGSIKLGASNAKAADKWEIYYGYVVSTANDLFSRYQTVHDSGQPPAE